MRALQRGDIEAVIREWRPLAEAGEARGHAAAAEWYRRAAEQDHARTQFNLGARYDLGVGVERDLPRAHQWMTLAAAQGDRNAFDYRTRLEGRMTEDEIAEAKRLVREFLAVEREL